MPGNPSIPARSSQPAPSRIQPNLNQNQNTQINQPPTFLQHATGQGNQNPAPGNSAQDAQQPPPFVWRGTSLRELIAQPRHSPTAAANVPVRNPQQSNSLVQQPTSGSNKRSHTQALGHMPTGSQTQTTDVAGPSAKRPKQTPLQGDGSPPLIDLSDSPPPPQAPLVAAPRRQRSAQETMDIANAVRTRGRMQDDSLPLPSYNQNRLNSRVVQAAIREDFTVLAQENPGLNPRELAQKMQGRYPGTTAIKMEEVREPLTRAWAFGLPTDVADQVRSIARDPNQSRFSGATMTANTSQSGRLVNPTAFNEWQRLERRWDTNPPPRTPAEINRYLARLDKTEGNAHIFAALALPDGYVGTPLEALQLWQQYEQGPLDLQALQPRTTPLPHPHSAAPQAVAIRGQNTSNPGPANLPRNAAPTIDISSDSDDSSTLSPVVSRQATTGGTWAPVQTQQGSSSVTSTGDVGTLREAAQSLQQGTLHPNDLDAYIQGAPLQQGDPLQSLLGNNFNAPQTHRRLLGTQLDPSYTSVLTSGGLPGDQSYFASSNYPAGSGAPGSGNVRQMQQTPRYQQDPQHQQMTSGGSPTDTVNGVQLQQQLQTGMQPIQSPPQSPDARDAAIVDILETFYPANDANLQNVSSRPGDPTYSQQPTPNYNTAAGMGDPNSYVQNQGQPTYAGGYPPGNTDVWQGQQVQQPQQQQDPLYAQYGQQVGQPGQFNPPQNSFGHTTTGGSQTGNFTAQQLQQFQQTHQQTNQTVYQAPHNANMQGSMQLGQPLLGQPNTVQNLTAPPAGHAPLSLSALNVNYVLNPGSPPPDSSELDVYFPRGPGGPN